MKKSKKILSKRLHRMDFRCNQLARIPKTAVIKSSFDKLRCRLSISLETLALLSLALLSACSIANNKVGYSLSFNNELPPECVERIFPQIKGISEIVTTSSGYNGFSLGGYEIGLVFTNVKGSVTGYEILIDGMYQLESYGSFTQNASKLNKEIREHFEEGCLAPA